jgi:DNA-binding NarL/FixJ family response regulator
MTRVVIADDQAVIRTGLRMILEANGIQVSAEAGDGHAVLDAVAEHSPDVVLMDIRMPELDGIEATRRLVSRGDPAKVLILTTYGLDEYVYEALRAGAAGFILKTDSPDRLVDAVRVVATGEALLAPEITRRLIDRYLSGPPPDRAAPRELADLTGREHEVLVLIARGQSNAEIGNSLHVSEGTVKTHVARVLAKLGVRDRVQAVVYAYEHGVIQPGLPRDP